MVVVGQGLVHDPVGGVALAPDDDGHLLGGGGHAGQGRLQRCPLGAAGQVPCEKKFKSLYKISRIESNTKAEGTRASFVVRQITHDRKIH